MTRFQNNEVSNLKKINYVRKDLSGLSYDEELICEIIACRLYQNGVQLFLALPNGSVYPTEIFSLELTDDNPFTNIMNGFGPREEAPLFDVQSLVGRQLMLTLQAVDGKRKITDYQPLLDEWDDVC